MSAFQSRVLAVFPERSVNEKAAAKTKSHLLECGKCEKCENLAAFEFLVQPVKEVS